MKNYKTIWKSLKNNVTAFDVVNYCLLKVLAAKNENKFELTKIFLSKAFTPIRNPKKLANGVKHPYQVLFNIADYLRRSVQWKDGLNHKIFGLPVDEIFDSPEEFEKYKEIILSLYDYDLNKLDRHYCYIFVDTGSVTPEQAMVQAAHATMVVGKEMEDKHNPHEIYFQVVERPVNISAYELAKAHQQFDFHHFVEPDLGGIIVASAISPVPWYKREELKQYPLLSFSN
jgi:hypothetical protein